MSLCPIAWPCLAAFGLKVIYIKQSNENEASGHYRVGDFLLHWKECGGVYPILERRLFGNRAGDPL